MTRRLLISVSLMLLAVAMPLCAANGPRAGTDSQKPVVWTNDDLEKLHIAGLISIVGQVDDETPQAYEPAPYVETQDPEWYAEQAAGLRDELERRRAQLREYRQAIEDAQNLRETTGGISLDEGDIAMTPEAGVALLERRVEVALTELDDLEDLARRNDIPPGTLRGQ